MATLNDFLANVITQDTKKRQQCYELLSRYLGDPRSSLECDDTDGFINGLIAWVTCSNYKISMNGLELLCLMIDRMGEDFKPHVTSVLSACVDRLGDSKEQVREQAQQLLLKLMMPASSPQYVFERIASSFSHKLWHVRQGVLVCLQNTINRYGARCLTLSKIVPSLCKLLDDQTPQVRESAVDTLSEIYRHVGEKVRNDLAKKSIAPQRLNQVFARFDDVKMSGDMLATADLGPGRGDRGEDEVDFAKPVSAKVPKTKRPTGSAISTSSTTSTGSKIGLKSASASGPSTGGVDEDAFVRAFEDVPKVQMFSARDLTTHLSKCKDTLADTNIAWEKRVDALKTLRGVVVAGGADYDDFYPFLRVLEPCFMNSIKDLRSQVVREGCISVGYFSQRLGSRFDHSAETLLPVLINLIPNSAKIMSTSGIVCIRYIIQYTHASRLVPIITNNMSSKASIIRRYSYEFLNQILQSWPTHILEKHIAVLQEAIKKGISDADSEARSFARKSFWGFAEHFKEQADALMNHLDAGKQRSLQGELSLSSSNNSLNGDKPASAGRVRVRSASQDRSYESSTLGRIGKKGHQRFRSTRSDTGGDLDNDEIDGGQEARQKSHVVSSHSSSRISPHVDTGHGRTKPRMGNSQSQPSSRSSSPTPRGSYITHTTGHTAPRTPSRPRKAMSNPRSTGTSRETSPSRSVKSSGYGQSSGYGLPGRERRSSTSKVRTLKQGQDVEELVANALRQPMRRRYDTYDSDDNASETSSVCSERSFSSSYGKTSEDMGEILSLLQSSSYQDRKEGVVSLQRMLRNSRYLSRIELKKATEIFTRMFHDPHSKVFSLFLDMLVDLVQVHGRDITDWLYVLLSRLLNKVGADILGSLQAKVQRALDATRENFPSDLQFNILTRFIVDQTQSPSMKVKLAMLNYLNTLVLCMEPSDFTNSSDTRLVLSRIITWTNEPKSTDVRKSAQSVLIALFNLNPPEFSMMLSGLPKTFQDVATRLLLQPQMKSGAEHDVLTPRNVASPQSHQNRSRPPSRGPYGRDEADTENMNPEDIYNSIKKTSADIQNLSINSKLDHYDDMKKQKEFTSQDSGVQDLRNDSPDPAELKKSDYNPQHYQEEGSYNGHIKTQHEEPSYYRDDDMFYEEQGDEIAEILQVLSRHNDRHEERKTAMFSLMKLSRDGAVELWDTHFKSILLILLETLGDDNEEIRCHTLRVLREILQNQSRRFEDFAELTFLRVLEAHEVNGYKVRLAAEECAATLASHFPPNQSVRILAPIIQKKAFPINLSAIKMQTKVVQQLTTEDLSPILHEIVPGLLKAYDDYESSVRKATVFCLVEIYLVVGDLLRPHMADLPASKIKLLDLYIKRAQVQKDTGKVESPHYSDAS